MADLGVGDLVDGLRCLKVQPGGFIEVHSSLSSFGWVAGGADTIITALLQAVGQDGSVVMPAAQASRGVPLTPEEWQRGLTWKVRVLDPDDLTTPTFQGRVADRFRTWPGVVRDSYSAWGAHADDFCHGLAPFVEAGGRCVLLGVGLDRASCLHTADHRVQIPADIKQLQVPPADVQRDYPSDTWWIGYDARRLGREVKTSHLLQAAADDLDLLTRTKIGAANCMSCEAKPLVEVDVRLRQERPYQMHGLLPPTSTFP